MNTHMVHPKRVYFCLNLYNYFIVGNLLKTGVIILIQFGTRIQRLLFYMGTRARSDPGGDSNKNGKRQGAMSYNDKVIK